jgi:hypothetical protein
MPTKATPKKTSRKAVKSADAAAPMSTDNAPAEAVNANAGEIKPQQRQDLDIGHYRQLLLDEMSRLEEEREYVRKKQLGHGWQFA